MSKFKILDDGLVINKISKSYGNKQVVRNITYLLNKEKLLVF